MNFLWQSTRFLVACQRLNNECIFQQIFNYDLIWFAVFLPIGKQQEYLVLTSAKSYIDRFWWKFTLFYLPDSEKDWEKHAWLRLRGTFHDSRSFLFSTRRWTNARTYEAGCCFLRWTIKSFHEISLRNTLINRWFDSWQFNVGWSFSSIQFLKLENVFCQRHFPMLISNSTIFVISMLSHQTWNRRRKLWLGCWRIDSVLKFFFLWKLRQDLGHQVKPRIRTCELMENHLTENRRMNPR
jgi:hypothetical protein